MKKAICLLCLVLSFNCFANIPKTKDGYYTNLKYGCKIVAGMADLAMHYRQSGMSFKNAKKAITTEKVMKKKQSDARLGRRLESIYNEILVDIYKIKIEKNEMKKMKLFEKNANKFYKKCLKEKRRI